MKKDIYKKIAKEVINTEIVSLNKLKNSLDINFKKTVEEISELNEVEVKIVWEPPWDKTKMSEAARLELGL